MRFSPVGFLSCLIGLQPLTITTLVDERNLDEVFMERTPNFPILLPRMPVMDTVDLTTKEFPYFNSWMFLDNLVEE
mgnify:CR=1 FL=1